MLQVADLAGVSTQTVSRYLRHDDRIAPELRERIARAVEQLDYRPNLAARAMRTRRSGLLAIVLPLGNAAGSLGIIDGARTAADASGFQLEAILLDSRRTSREERVLELVEAGFFEGLVSLVQLPHAAMRPAWSGAPVLVTNDYDEHMRSIGRLASADILTEIIERLAAAGHRRLLHLAGNHLHTSSRERKDVFLAVADRLGLEASVAECDADPARAGETVAALPSHDPPTALVAGNDRLAVAAIRAAEDRGWSVPTDLVVTGWDDHSLSALTRPSLTTVATHWEIVGDRAVRRLVALVRGEPEPVDERPLTRVVWRESTGRLPELLEPPATAAPRPAVPQLTSA